ncbi:bc7fae0e-4b3c-4f11-9928-94a8ee074e99-CDS [Sclerotinia trifoliorum]|uniref:Bc7fae0e-4b3c-4f11-9928-94a8ee074e99-CDS n=1 Tax=Sclerotinia trifoliorum TaxID=28548 RepID=A0A8H2VSQ5_9HELO|nr:bc7fae0e-4b3c-4f11-9928-94a8ee074e99-CDS [Sclerotinia trifoliorum]
MIHNIRWSSLLSQPEPSTTTSKGKDNPATKSPYDTDEKAKSCETPLATPIHPLDVDRRFFITPSSPPTSPKTKPESSTNCLTEEALLALTSQSLIHGGAWSSPRKPKCEKRAKEKVYTGIGEAPRPKTPSELARGKQWISKRKTAAGDKRREVEDVTMNQVTGRDRWTKPEPEDGLDVANWCRGSWR